MKKLILLILSLFSLSLFWCDWWQIDPMDNDFDAQKIEVDKEGEVDIDEQFNNIEQDMNDYQTDVDVEQETYDDSEIESEFDF